MTEQERFDRCLGAVLRLEGGYVDDPRDRGGPTRLGVTQAALSRWLGCPASLEAVKALTPQAVAPIYHGDYWRSASCGTLPAGLDLMVFDAAVNMGPGVAARLLQRAAGVEADGVIGRRTLGAVVDQGAQALIEAMTALRGDRYRRLADFAVFGTGWMRRLATVRRLALAWSVPTEGQAA